MLPSTQQVGIMLGSDCDTLWDLFPLWIYRQMLWLMHL